MSGEVVVIVTPSGGIWFDALTLIAYLRDREQQMAAMSNHPSTDRAETLAALSMGDAIRQIADGLTLSTMAVLAETGD